MRERAPFFIGGAKTGAPLFFMIRSAERERAPKNDERLILWETYKLSLGPINQENLILVLKFHGILVLWRDENFHPMNKGSILREKFGPSTFQLIILIQGPISIDRATKIHFSKLHSQHIHFYYSI